MGARGRKSVEQQSIAVINGGRSIPRPNPPASLTSEQSAEWRRVVDALDASWFPPETHNLLEQYCRHTIAARHVAQLISELERVAALDEKDGGGFDLDEYDKLLKMQEREGRAMSSLATRMRITQQATYHPEKSKGKGRGRMKPHEFSG